MQNSRLIELSAVNVSLRHEGFCQEVLHNITFNLEEGQHVAILGANGAGKSTFLRLLGGEIFATAGNITWHLHGKAEQSPIMGRRMATLISHAKQEAYVRQEWRLSGEDILLTAFSASSTDQLLYFIPDAEQKKAAQRMAESINAKHLLHQEACTLSQGQLRLLLLGRALLRSPKVLLLDEYLDGLDDANRINILHVLKDCGCTLVLTDHRENAIPTWVKHIYTMEQGHLLKNTVPATTKADASLSTIPVNEKALPRQTQQNKDIKKLTFIDIQNATVFIDRNPILRRICWQWQEGEHWRLHGVNGSGKSTFLRLLAADEHVAFDGGTLRRRFKRFGEKHVSELALVRSGLALLSAELQQTYGYDVTGLECVLSGLDTVQGTYRIYDEKEITQAQEFLRRFHLQNLEDRRIRSLSTGQLRRLLLARLLMGEPELLLLDEPFSGLDQASYKAMRHLLEEEAFSGRVHILLVSHYEDDHLACINRQMCMQQGQLQVYE